MLTFLFIHLAQRLLHCWLYSLRVVQANHHNLGNARHAITVHNKQHPVSGNQDTRVLGQGSHVGIPED